MTLPHSDAYDPVPAPAKDDDVLGFQQYPPAQPAPSALPPPHPASANPSNHHPQSQQHQQGHHQQAPQAPPPMPSLPPVAAPYPPNLPPLAPSQYPQYDVAPADDWGHHAPPQQYHDVALAPYQAPALQFHHHYPPQQMELAGYGAPSMMPMAPAPPQDIGNQVPQRKVAPRSSDLFRVGPPFSHLRHHHQVFSHDSATPVTPRLSARIDRGFELDDQGTWIGYKRNYFTLVAAFQFDGFDFDRFIANEYFVSASDRHGREVKRPVRYFAIRLVAKCSDDEVQISLIQHTAKRDKGPQFPPPMYPAVPGNLPDHETVKASCNKRNGSKIENMNRIFYYQRQRDLAHVGAGGASVLASYPSDSIARVARFERIQFTSSIRIKSSSINTRYFTLHVELLAVVDDDELSAQPVVVSSVESPPLIIRGRSPSNYHKERPQGFFPRGDAHPHHHHD
ncbi:hypothetical protein DIURU_001271 [Diutina rugosa]|uniref:NDT80 domain-containing protein n=1 Tax=Diutina rugosa TaxID=5481 RepID=A0A642V1T1_DIURU|nr:uncharacterized protein DIURU_001271 [Diutina rugosa]KAA8906088.1 hypothetical protein DIURU_001271 [Diutina rugosa]